MGSEKLLTIRAYMIRFFKQYEKWLVAMLKCLGTIIVLALISQKIGYVEGLTKSYTIIGIGLICMLAPVQVMLFVFMSIIAIHLIEFNLLLGCVCIVSFLILYFAFILLYPVVSLLIFITMVAFTL